MQSAIPGAACRSRLRSATNNTAGRNVGEAVAAASEKKSFAVAVLLRQMGDRYGISRAFERIHDRSLFNVDW